MGILRYVKNVYIISSWVVCNPSFISSFPLGTARILTFELQEWPFGRFPRDHHISLLLCIVYQIKIRNYVLVARYLLEQEKKDCSKFSCLFKVFLALVTKCSGKIEWT